MVRHLPEKCIAAIHFIQNGFAAKPFFSES
jgi:hypothetical protein